MRSRKFNMKERSDPTVKEIQSLSWKQLYGVLVIAVLVMAASSSGPGLVSFLNGVTKTIVSYTAPLPVEISDGVDTATVSSPGDLSVTLGTRIAGEDIDLDLMKVAPGGTPTYFTTNTQIKGSAGLLLYITAGSVTTAGELGVYDDLAGDSGTAYVIDLTTRANGQALPTIVPGGIFSTGIYVRLLGGLAGKFTALYK